MALHISQKGTQIGVKNDINDIRRGSSHNNDRTITRKVMIFECVFCRTAHSIEATSGNLENAHRAVNDILDAGCNKCGGRVMFKEHRSIAHNALNGRR